MQEQEYDIIEQDDPKPRPSLKGKPRPTLEKKKGQVGGEFGIGAITGSEIPTIQLEKSELGIPSTSNKEFAKNNLDPSVEYNETVLSNSVNTGSPILGEIQIKDQDIPVANKQLYRKELQDRIANKKLLDEDANILATVTGRPKEAIVAYISGRDGKGLMLEFDNVKLKKANQFVSLIEKNNAELGLNDTFESVFATPETTKNYLDKIQQAYDNKTDKDFNSLNTRTIDGKTITYDEESERYIDKRLPAGRRYYDAIKNKNDATVGQFKKLVGEDIFRKIADEPDKTYDQKVKQAGDILYDTELNKIEKAKGKRSAISAISDYFPILKLSGIFRDEKSEEQNLNAINSVVETKLNRAIKEQIVYDQAALANLAQDVSEKTANGKVTEQDIANYKEAAEQLRNKIDEKQKEYKTPQQLQKKYPVLLKQSVINDINEFNAIQSGNVKGYEEGGYEGINLVEHLKAQGYDMDDQVVKDAIVDAVKGVGIKDYSFFGEPIKAIKEVFTSSAKSLGDITGLRDDVTVLSEKTAADLFPTQVGKGDEYQLTESAKIGQNIGNTTGQVLGQGLMQFGTAGIGRLAGLSKVAAVNAGFWGSGALTSYDNAYKDSMDFVESDAGRTAYAGLIALANAASEKIFPEAKLFNIPGVKSAFSELATKMSSKELTDKLATQLLTKAKNAFIDYGEKYAKNVGKETLEETATSLFESGTRFLFGDPNIDYDKAIELAKNTAIQTAIGTSVIGGFGAHKDVQLEKNISPKSIIYNAAVYHDEAMDALNIGFKNGEYDQQELNKKISLLNTAQAGLGELKKAEEVIGRELSRPQKELFVANTTAQRLLTKQKEGVEDNAVLQRIDEKLKNLNTQQTQLLDNKVQIDEVGNVIVPEKEKPLQEDLQQKETAEAIISTLEGKKEVSVDELAAMKENPVLALETIADQALGFGRVEGVRQPLTDEANTPQLQQTIDKYGQEVVDKAIAMFPAEDISSPKNNKNEINPDYKDNELQGKRETGEHNVLEDQSGSVPGDNAKERQPQQGEEEVIRSNAAPEKETGAATSSKEESKPTDVSKLSPIQNHTDIYNEFNNDKLDVKKGEEFKGREEFKRAVNEVEKNTDEKVIRRIANIDELSTTENIYGLSGDKDLSKYESEIKNGIQAPIVVEFDGNKFNITDGHHRLEAYKKLGYKEVPIIVNESGDFYLSAKKLGIDVSNLDEMPPQEIEKIRNEINKKQIKKPTDVVGSEKPSENKPILNEEITNLEKERDAEIEKVIKPNFKLELVSSKELVDSKDPIGNREKHNELKERYKSLRKLIDCL